MVVSPTGQATYAQPIASRGSAQVRQHESTGRAGHLSLPPGLDVKLTLAQDSQVLFVSPVNRLHKAVPSAANRRHVQIHGLAMTDTEMPQSQPDYQVQLVLLHAVKSPTGSWQKRGCDCTWNGCSLEE